MIGEKIIEKLNDEFGKEAPLSVTRGTVHKSLGMKIDFLSPHTVVFSMIEYIKRLLANVPDELMKGSSTSPAGNHLFQINDNANKLDPSSAILYHHLTAQLLYLGKQTRPDLLLAVSFLCTRVQSPDKDDWKKLGQCLRFLRNTKTDKLTLEAGDEGIIQWWIDACASFAAHPNVCSHTGATVSDGRQTNFTRCGVIELMVISSHDTMLLLHWFHFLHYMKKSLYSREHGS